VTDHFGDEIPGLLAGELGLAQATALLAHARACPRCADALFDELGAHLALARAARELRVDGTARPVPPAAAAPRGPLQRWLAAAAAVVVVAGAVAAGYALGRPSRPAPQAAVAGGVLRPVSGGTAPRDATGTVVMRAFQSASRQMTVTIRGLPAAPGGHFYEVWLLAPATGKMLPVGVLSVGTGPVSFRLPTAVTVSYGAVDISLQRNDGNPAHSADSVLRAAIRAARSNFAASASTPGLAAARRSESRADWRGRKGV
jgi:hypothetical protein